MTQDIQFLKELQKELKYQEECDYDGQAAPRFWVLRDYKWMPTGEGYHERTSLYFPNDADAETVQDFVERMLENEDDEYTEEQLEELKEYGETGSDEDVLGWAIEHYDDDTSLVYEKKEAFIVPNTMFLTKKEAKRHIELNHYHYTSEVHTYAMTAWRAPKVEKLLQILEHFDWDSIEVKEKEIKDKEVKEKN